MHIQLVKKLLIVIISDIKYSFAMRLISQVTNFLGDIINLCILLAGFFKIELMLML